MKVNVLLPGAEVLLFKVCAPTLASGVGGIDPSRRQSIGVLTSGQEGLDVVDIGDVAVDVLDCGVQWALRERITVLYQSYHLRTSFGASLGDRRSKESPSACDDDSLSL